MKIFAFFPFLLLVFMTITAFGSAKQTTVTDLPKAITNYLDTHFSGIQIAYIEVDRNPSGKEYDVHLMDGTELEFDSKHAIEDISSKTALPASVIPKTISEYVEKQYPQTFILEWSKEGRNRQEVKLSNGLELTFDLHGKFIRLDD